MQVCILTTYINLNEAQVKSGNIQSDGDTRSLCSNFRVDTINFLSMYRICRGIASQDKRLSLLITANTATNGILRCFLLYFFIRFYGESGSYDKGGMSMAAAKRWVLSCIPDYIAWIILMLGIGYHLFFGKIS